MEKKESKTASAVPPLTITHTGMSYSGVLGWSAVTQIPPVAKPAKARLSLSQASESSTFVRTLFVNSVLFSSLLLLIPFIIYRTVVIQPILEPIGVPGPLKKYGYSEDVVAHRLWESIDHIVRDVNTSKTKFSLRPSSREIEIAVPETGISFKSLGHFLRQMFGLYEMRISGEFVCVKQACDPDSYALQLRVIGAKVRGGDPISFDRTKHTAFFHDSALKLIELVDPYLAASYYYWQDDIEKAEEISRQILHAGSPDIHWAHNLLGLIRVKTGAHEEAMRHFLQALHEKPNFSAARGNMGTALLRKKDYAGAIKQYQLAIGLDAKFTNAYYNWGIALLRSKKFTEAIERFEKTTLIDPDFVDAYTELGYALELKDPKNRQLAIDKYRYVLTIQPNNSNARNKLGNALIKTGEKELALAQFNEMVRIKPKDSAARNNLGAALSEMGNYDSAIVQFEKALEFDPDNSDARRNLGVMLLHKGDYADAEVHFELAAESEPENASIYVSWARSLLEQGKNHAGLRQLANALRVDPQHAAARKSFHILKHVLHIPLATPHGP